MEKLAIRLKELREERGLSQMAAGTALGWSKRRKIILLTRAKKSIKIKMSQMCLRAHLKNGVITAIARV